MLKIHKMCTWRTTHLELFGSSRIINPAFITWLFILYTHISYFSCIATHSVFTALPIIPYIIILYQKFVRRSAVSAVDPNMIFFVRHVEVSEDDSMTPKGKLQADKVASRLHGYSTTHSVTILSSTSKRSRDTANIIAEKFNNNGFELLGEDGKDENHMVIF